MPDIIVSDRTQKEQQYLNKLARKGLIHQFTLHHVDNHRKELQKYDNVDSFVHSYQVSDNLFREFMRFASDKGVKPDEELSYDQKKELKIFLKAFIGRYLFDDKGFYPIYHQIDESFLKALEIIEIDSLIKTGAKAKNGFVPGREGMSARTVALGRSRRTGGVRRLRRRHEAGEHHS